MKKKILIAIIITILAVLASGAVLVFAADERLSVNPGETIEGDFITSGYSITNDGTIKGDMILFSQILSVNGQVGGDIIGYAMDMTLNGDVGGSVRVLGTNVNVSSRISRNAMIFGSITTLSESAVIMKNAYLLGGSLKCLGRVEGNTDVHCNDVTLGGTYNGDVYIHGMSQNSSFRILPGTVINGTLTYEGVTPFTPPGDVSVKDFRFVQINPASNPYAKRFDLSDAVKLIITLSVYYLFALLLYKIFPRFFTRSGDFIAQKPLSSAGIGIAALGTFVGSLLLLLLLLLLTVFALKFAIFGFTGLLLFFVGIVTILFADIPVSLWLGGLISRGSSVPARLAIGLALISAVKYALALMRDLLANGYPFGVLRFLLSAAIWLLGTGAIFNTILNIIRSANRKAEEDEAGPPENTYVETI
jgi:hypothetical protein